MAAKEISNLRLIEKNLTIAGSVKGGLMLSKAVTLYGERNVVLAVAGAILMTASMFNVGNNISDDQAILIASDLIEKYPTENIEDILLMLKTIRTSGAKMYGKFDAETIFSEMDRYMDLKIDERERQYQEQKKEYQIDGARTSGGESALKEQVRASMNRYIKEKAKSCLPS